MSDLGGNYSVAEREMDNRTEWQKHIGVGERQVVYGRHAGTSRDIPVRREDNGKVGGKQTEHWDGSVDATAKVDTIRAVFDRKTGEVVPKEAPKTERIFT